MHVYIRTYMNICLHICTYICIQIYINIYIHTHIYVDVDVYIHIYVYVSVCVFTYIYLYEDLQKQKHPPAACSSFTAAAPSALFRHARIVVRLGTEPNLRAISLPIPLFAPVTTATRCPAGICWFVKTGECS